MKDNVREQRRRNTNAKKKDRHVFGEREMRRPRQTPYKRSKNDTFDEYALEIEHKYTRMPNIRVHINAGSAVLVT